MKVLIVFGFFALNVVVMCTIFWYDRRREKKQEKLTFFFAPEDFKPKPQNQRWRA